MPRVKLIREPFGDRFNSKNLIKPDRYMTVDGLRVLMATRHDDPGNERWRIYHEPDLRLPQRMRDNQRPYLAFRDQTIIAHDLEDDQNFAVLDSYSVRHFIKVYDMRPTYDTKDLLSDAYPIYIDGVPYSTNKDRIPKDTLDMYPSVGWAFKDECGGKPILIRDQQVEVDAEGLFNVTDQDHRVRKIELYNYNGEDITRMPREQVIGSRYRGDFS